jgi:hypothetical protein
MTNNELLPKMMLRSALPANSPQRRVLCLKLQKQSFNAGVKSAMHRSMPSVVETFRPLAARIQLRAPGWLFLEAPHAQLASSEVVSGELRFVKNAVLLASELGFTARAAMAGTPAGAQALAMARENFICLPADEQNELHSLSLPYLVYLEGLDAWSDAPVIEEVISFCMTLGLKTLGDLASLKGSVFTERWGETGRRIWERLHARDRDSQCEIELTPPVQTSVYRDEIEFDSPILIPSLLLRQVDKSVDFIFRRIDSRRSLKTAQSLTLEFQCEPASYAPASYRIEIAPPPLFSGKENYLSLIEAALANMNFESPFRGFKIAVHVTSRISKTGQNRSANFARRPREFFSTTKTKESYGCYFPLNS